MIIQLNPSIPVVIVSKNNESGQAFALIDYSKEDHVIWGVAMDKGGEVWWVENPDIRFCANVSIGRTK